MIKCICNGKEERSLGTVGPELGGFSHRIFVYIQDNNLRVFGEGPEDAAGDIPINFCPICGRALKQKSYLLHKPSEAKERASVRYA